MKGHAISQAHIGQTLEAQRNQLLTEWTHLEWLTKGWTILTLKDTQKGAIQTNYRPITCLFITWKLLSGIIVARIGRHMAQFMSGSQKRIGRNTRGGKHQLLVDRSITQDCKTK